MTYNRYDNGKIYQITNNLNDMVYIGSTCLPLRKRWYNQAEFEQSFVPGGRLHGIKYASGLRYRAKMVQNGSNGTNGTCFDQTFETSREALAVLLLYSIVCPKQLPFVPFEPFCTISHVWCDCLVYTGQNTKHT